MIRRLLAGLALALVASAALAATPCPQNFAGGREPALSAPPAGHDPILCEAGYALEHAAAWREPVWSAEHMTAESVAAARANKRAGAFHAEAQLPAGERATNADYAKSGFDKGHQAPVGDFGPLDQKQATFSLANMSPQKPNLNRMVWAGIEEAVRQLAATDGEIYVVTGPIIPDGPQMLNGRVAVPSYSWKAVYDPKKGAAAYLCSNIDEPVCSTLSIAKLKVLTGIDLFPILGAAIEAVAIDLPEPTKGGPLAR